MKIRIKLGKIYFANLLFTDFDEYQYCVFHESLHDALKYNPPTWFVTVDPDPKGKVEDRKICLAAIEACLVLGVNRIIDLFKKLK